MRTSFTLAVAGLVVACGNPNTTKQPPQDTATAKQPATGDGAQPAPPVPDDAPPKDPAVARRERAEEALKRLDTVKKGLAELRGLEFKSDVPGVYQEQADFQTFVTDEVSKSFSAEKADAVAGALLHIGFLDKQIDLRKTLGDAMTSQAAAYYDPKQKKFFVVMAPNSELEIDAITSHELTHALQDQHFDLNEYLEPGGKSLDEDEGNARKFVVEGEATLTMTLYAAKSMGVDPLSPMVMGAMKAQLGQFASMSIEDFKNMTRSAKAGTAGMDDEIQKALDAMDSIPPVILVPMMDSYVKGVVTAFSAYEHGGWKTVGELYTSPPDSTEQVLHPDTKLYPKRDAPKKVTLAAIKGYSDVYGNTIGELDWRVYFGMWFKDGAEKSADGWDGDRFNVVKNDADGTQVGLIATTWDSAAEAKEFATAYEKTVAVRFPSKERQVWIKTKGSNVYIVDGGTDAKLIDKLIKGTKIK